ncbi:MAG: excinuclease ABC subunit UvrC [Candidatus Omnitrophica bacterium]|nr:excinuclease ABC subunit UvrC [Candidatus Omnitrophota bacterium]MDD5488443.1 excinuclease ABC subunit UvrC [Candidatus Omnitrophota bacterium]
MDRKTPDIREKVRSLPDSPGVYMFLDRRGKIIYVGKAARLRRRVSSYFRSSSAKSGKLRSLARETRDIRIVPASSEAEALVYEAGLIKDHSPRYNVDLKDDKSYPYIKLTVNESFPRVVMTRRRVNDGALYYGPYVDAGLLKDALSFMKKIFPLRTCGRFHKNVCLEYHLGQCQGPCEGRVTEKEYRETVENLKKFLEGRKGDLLSALREKMIRHAEKREYEKSMAIKERIEALTAVREFHGGTKRPMYGELDELKNVLGAVAMPETIECFDISNISGQKPVGSMVKFRHGRPSRKEYRKFRIKGVSGIDDYSMMREIVRRRYARLVADKGELPDLVLIDGGKGHLSVAMAVMDELGIKDMMLASIAKEYNHLYLPGRAHPVRLSPGSRLLSLVQRIRDEAHRFAITYHRKVRGKAYFGGMLTDIKGIGPARERELMEKFGSRGKVSEASFDELIARGIDRRTASIISSYFSTGKEPR